MKSYKFNKSYNEKYERYLLNKISNIKSRDLILRSNGRDVIQFALQFLKAKEGQKVVKYIIPSLYNLEHYMHIMTDERKLENKYYEVYNIAQKEYSNKEVDKYHLNSGDIYKTGLFICMVKTEDNQDSTGKFDAAFASIFNEEPLPIQFLLNCRLNRGYLRTNPIEIVAMCLLQIIYIQEENLGFLQKEIEFFAQTKIELENKITQYEKLLQKTQSLT